MASGAARAKASLSGSTIRGRSSQQQPTLRLRRCHARSRSRARAIPEERRQVILLISLEAASYEEAATILDVPMGTIRSRLSRGRESHRILMHWRDGTEAVSAAAVTSTVPKRRRFLPEVETNSESSFVANVAPGAEMIINAAPWPCRPRRCRGLSRSTARRILLRLRGLALDFLVQFRPSVRIGGGAPRPPTGNGGGGSTAAVWEGSGGGRLLARDRS
jgi:Sigma-70, region 4